MLSVYRIRSRALRGLLNDCFEILHTPPPQNAVDWADEHYYLSPESSGRQQRWWTYPYQRAPLLCMTSDDIKWFNWIKSARVGYTKLLCIATAYFTVHRRRNGVIYQPTDTDAKDFVTDEINTALRDVKVFGDLLMSEPGVRSPYNTTSKKQFLGANLDIKGGKSATAYRRLTKDFVIYDELDGFDRDIEGEGAPTSLGDVRIQASSYPKSIRGSTPRLQGVSLIAAEADEADMFFRRYVPCPACDHMQVLTWKESLRFDNKDPDTTRMECIACHEHITYDKYPWMDEHGVWRTEDGIWIDEDAGRFYDGAAEPVAPPRSVSFHIWAGYSYSMNWADITDEFLKANVEKKKGNHGPMKTFVNVILGETYGEDRVAADKELLKQHREPYPVEVPDGVLHLTAGVDIQDDRFEIEIVGWGEHHENWSIHYRAMYGRMELPEIWDILAEMLNKTYYGTDGTPHHIKLACIDSGGHYTSEVYTFCTRKPAQYIPIKGHSEAGKPIASFPPKLQVNKNQRYRLTMVGTDTAKELIYGWYGVTEPGPGYCHYPIGGKEGPHVLDEYGDAFFDMATAEHYILTYRRGHPIRVWEKENSRRNEALDCRVYNLAAIRILQQHYGCKLESAVESQPEQPAAPPPTNTEPPTTITGARSQRNRKPRKSGGFTKGWRK
jgi:phage terminase large subunit GpA-like protein